MVSHMLDVHVLFELRHFPKVLSSNSLHKCSSYNLNLRNKVSVVTALSSPYRQSVSDLSHHTTLQYLHVVVGPLAPSIASFGAVFR